MTPRPYQRPAIRYLTKTRRGILQAPAGSGKTFMAATAVNDVLARREKPARICVICNTIEQVEQWCDAFRLYPDAAFWADIDIGCAAGDIDPTGCDLLIVDECVVGSQLISGIRADQIKKGDFVDSFCHKSGRVEKQIVQDVFRRDYQGKFLRIKTANGQEIICTEGHPIFFKKHGYLPAICLQRHELGTYSGGYEMLTMPPANNQATPQNARFQVLLNQMFGTIQVGSNICYPTRAYFLRKLRGGIDSLLQVQKGLHRCKKEREVLLFRLLQKKLSLAGFVGSYDEDKSQIQIRDCRQNEEQQSRARPGYNENNQKQSDGQKVQGAGRQWEVYKAATKNLRTLRRETRTRSQHEEGKRSWIYRHTKFLQSGYRFLRSKSRRRDRWEKSFAQKKPSQRFQKRHNVEFSRVESVEVYECGSGSRPDWMPSDNSVYNFSIAKNENFFAGGILTHNCHHALSKSWSAKIRRAAKGRWGLSATPFGPDEERNAILRDVFTNRIHEVKRDALVEHGHLAPAAVRWIDVQPPEGFTQRIHDLTTKLIEKRRRKMPPWFFDGGDKEREQINQCKWQAVQQVALWDNEARDALIVRQANELLSHGHHVIVLIGKIEHGERLVGAIPGAVLCYSRMGRKKRREAIENFKCGAVRCLIATSMLDEGFDAPIADCIIMASAGKSFRKAVQSTGRVLRRYEGKERGVIVDFFDGYNPMLARQAQKRRGIYRGLKYSDI